MAKPNTEYLDFEPGSKELVDTLVADHMGWATSIARSVARAWNLDWQLDGLDGGAFEGLLFCAGRFDPARGVPFRAYARRRIHESATEEARKSKTWQRGVDSDPEGEGAAREISATLFQIFPELHNGLLPKNTEPGEAGMRTSVRQLLASASLVSAFHEGGPNNPETVAEYKSLVTVVAQMEPVHQSILFSVYWKGLSMRGLASEWEIDELAVIREHKEILGFLSKRLEDPKRTAGKKLKIRPGLRGIAQSMRKNNEEPPFARFAVDLAGVLALLLAVENFSIYFN